MSNKKFTKFYKKFGDPKIFASFDPASLEKYKAKLPESIFAMLIEDGRASYMDGFLWTINPEDHIDWLNNWIDLNVECIPFARTALGDILFMKDDYISVLYSNKALMTYLFDEAEWLFDIYLCDDKYVDAYFSRSLWNELGEEKNTLHPDECFGFQPILSLGGSEKAENLKKVKLREYLFILSEADNEVNFVD